MTMPIIATTVLAVAALLGAWLDVASRRLPNWLCLLTAITGLASAAVLGGTAAFISASGHMLIALMLGMALFRFGLIGGGDAKFYAACAAWFGLGQALHLLGIVSVVGLTLVIIWFGYRQIAGKRRRDRTGKFDLVPYGVAIGLGSIAARVLA